MATVNCAFILLITCNHLSSQEDVPEGFLSLPDFPIHPKTYKKYVFQPRTPKKWYAFLDVLLRQSSTIKLHISYIVSVKHLYQCTQRFKHRAHSLAYIHVIPVEGTSLRRGELCNLVSKI